MQSTRWEAISADEEPRSRPLGARECAPFGSSDFKLNQIPRTWNLELSRVESTDLIASCCLRHAAQLRSSPRLLLASNFAIMMSMSVSINCDCLFFSESNLQVH